MTKKYCVGPNIPLDR